MTAKEREKIARKELRTSNDKLITSKYTFTEEQFQAYKDQLCKEQRDVRKNELLNRFHNFLMDEFEGNASEEAIYLFLNPEGTNE